MSYTNRIIISCKLVLLATIILIAGSETNAPSKRERTDIVDIFVSVRDANNSCVLGPQLPTASINVSHHTAPGKLGGKHSNKIKSVQNESN